MADFSAPSNLGLVSLLQEWHALDEFKGNGRGN